MTLIFKIVGGQDWRAAEKLGVFVGSAVDRADGFIHFSGADQVAETASKWFSGRPDLILVAVNAQALGDSLRWETSRGGALFPHLYASLPISAVRWQRPLPLASDGRLELGRLDA
jgi:uncharacterized protein (DUF952 family)